MSPSKRHVKQLKTFPRRFQPGPVTKQALQKLKNSGLLAPQVYYKRLQCQQQI